MLKNLRSWSSIRLLLTRNFGNTELTWIQSSVEYRHFLTARQDFTTKGRENGNDYFFSWSLSRSSCGIGPIIVKQNKDLQHELVCTDAKIRRVQKTVQSPQRQFDTIRATVDRYRRGLLNFTERVRTEVTDSFGVFLFDVLPEARELTKKQLDIN